MAEVQDSSELDAKIEADRRVDISEKLAEIRRKASKDKVALKVSDVLEFNLCSEITASAMEEIIKFQSEDLGGSPLKATSLLVAPEHRKAFVAWVGAEELSVEELVMFLESAIQEISGKE